MATITVRVDPEVKKLMKKYSHIDWSEVVMRAILEELRREERKNIAEPFS